MGEIARNMICRNCNKVMEIEETLIAEGITKSGIHYFTTQPKETYLIDKNYFPSNTLLKTNFTEFCINYIPSFGKFEIESFIAKELMTALLITKELSSLFNTSIMLEDFFSGTFYITGEKLKEILLPLFDIKKTDNGYTCTFLEKKFKNVDFSSLRNPKN